MLTELRAKKNKAVLLSLTLILAMSNLSVMAQTPQPSSTQPSVTPTGISTGQSISPAPSVTPSPQQNIQSDVSNTVNPSNPTSPTTDLIIPPPLKDVPTAQNIEDGQLNPALRPLNPVAPLSRELTDTNYFGQHDMNRSFPLGYIHKDSLVKVESLNPFRLEATYSEPISLKQALDHALTNNLAIKINNETYQANKYSFFSALAGYLPSYNANYVYSLAKVQPDTSSSSNIFSTGVSLPTFQGGGILYTTLSNLYRMKAARAQYQTSINDTLMNVYTAYTNAILQRALLRIRIKAVEVDEEQLRLNDRLYENGVGTKLEVMQARTQLSIDQQALLQQQVNVRQAGLQLAFTLNFPLTVDLVPVETSVAEVEIYDEKLGINTILNTALKSRPELRQYEYLRLAANRNIQVAASSLYPTVGWNINYTFQDTNVTGSAPRGGLASAASAPRAGISRVSSPITSPAIFSTQAGSPVVNGASTGVSQITPGTGGLSVTPGTSNTTLGTTTSAATTAGTGTTVVTTGSGLSTGVGGAFGTTGQTVVGGSNPASIGIFGGTVSSISAGFNINWSLGNLGVSTVASILSSRAVARQALLQANQVLLEVQQQVRDSYINMKTAHENIDVASVGVVSSREELRLARMRLENGINTYLDLLTAQRDYINTLVNHAQAIISSNQAQAQLLHDTGAITVETLTKDANKQPIGLTPQSIN